MFADDRVLVAYVPKPSDFALIEDESWYRIPIKHAPKGIHAEWMAFYFGKAFGERQHAIHCYAPNLGHELRTRRELVPHEPTHPRANDVYYQVQLGRLRWLNRPIISLRWRRLLFLHTTADRFNNATEVNDLLIEGDGYVNRVQTALKEQQTKPYVVLKDSED